MIKVYGGAIDDADVGKIFDYLARPTERGSVFRTIIKALRFEAAFSFLWLYLTGSDSGGRLHPEHRAGLTDKPFGRRRCSRCL